MNLETLKKKTLSLIEELNPESEYLTDDPDIAMKHNEVINQVMYEMARIKRIPKYLEIGVLEGETLDLEDFERECGYQVFQVSKICGVAYKARASNTSFKFLESGTAEIDLFVYPDRITENTKDKAYEFELSPDVLEIMPYGIAADLLKSDVSTNYGAVYASRYETMLQRLDPRYATSYISVEGGIDI